MSCEWCQNSFEMNDSCSDDFKMWQGLTGPYYIPAIDDDGVLSWTNTGGLPNPDPVDISGPAGSSFEIAGIVASVSELPAGAPGVWLVGSAAPYEGYSYLDGAWKSIGQFAIGPRGPQGDPGPIGPAGPTGQTGPAGQGVPAGGTAGQVLAKASGSDYDTEWVDQSGSGGTPGTAIPLMDGTADAGVATAFAREDHRHPVDTSRASAAEVANLNAAINSKALRVTGTISASTLYIANASITTDMVLVECVFGTPSNVQSDLTWNTDTAGRLAFSGTLGGSTTVDAVLIKI